MSAPVYVGRFDTADDTVDRTFAEVAWSVHNAGELAKASEAESDDDVNYAIDAQLDRWIAACGGDVRVALYEALVMAAVGFEDHADRGGAS